MPYSRCAGADSSFLRPSWSPPSCTVFTEKHLRGRRQSTNLINEMVND
jgi:hypothetical protein